MQQHTKDVFMVHIPFLPSTAITDVEVNVMEMEM
jgi:hypothetical protein